MRAGTDATWANNKVRGTFLGPGVTGVEHYIEFDEVVDTLYLTIQLKSEDYLQINGVQLLTEKMPKGKARCNIDIVNRKPPPTGMVFRERPKFFLLIPPSQYFETPIDVT